MAVLIRRHHCFVGLHPRQEQVIGVGQRLILPMRVDGVELVREASIDEAPKSRFVSPMHPFRVEKLNDV